MAQLDSLGRQRLPEGTGGIRSVGTRGVSILANRKYLDSLFFRTKFFDPVEMDTSLTLFGVKLRTPVFCSPMGSVEQLTRSTITSSDIAKGVSNAGALMMGAPSEDASELQKVIDAGAPLVWIIKPLRDTERIYKIMREAESRGCIAVGMDIDHFYGRLGGDGERVDLTDLFAPQPTEELKQLVSQTKLPFIFKGVTSVEDAEKAAEIGASAIIVSTHGQMSVDFMVPSMIALPSIIESVVDKLTVLIDTGFRTGNDVLKALAFGAKAVGFGTSMMFAGIADGSVRAFSSEEAAKNIAAMKPEIRALYEEL